MAWPCPPYAPHNPPSFLSPGNTAHPAANQDPQPHGHVPAGKQTGLCWIAQVSFSLVYSPGFRLRKPWTLSCSVCSRLCSVPLSQ